MEGGEGEGKKEKDKTIVVVSIVEKPISYEFTLLSWKRA